MIKLVNFLILFKNITNYSKKDIDKGNTPENTYELCNIIRETFCMSYSIRKNNNLFIYFQKKHVLIKLIGIELKYLGPDERSQALLLLKAFEKISKNNIEYDNWIKSTPGIYFRQCSDDASIITILESINNKDFIFIIDESQVINIDFKIEIKSFSSLEKISEYFYIISTYPISKINPDFIQLIRKLKTIQFIKISNIKAVQDKILYLNFQIDRTQNL